MKILYIAHRIPYPPNKGDKIRTFNEIKYLSVFHEIHLACLADNPEDLKYDKNLKKHCEKVKVIPLNTKLAKIKSLIALLSKSPLSVSYFYSRQLQRTINNWVSATQYDAVICFCSTMAEYIFRSPQLNPVLNSNGPVLIMDFCDLDSEKWGQYANKSRFPFNIVYGIEHKRLFKYEKSINNAFHHSVVVSPREKELFTELYPSVKNITAIPNGVDYEYFSPYAKFDSIESGDSHSHPILVFTGAMDYYANIEGVTWFCNEILPGVKKTYPKVQFYIVGSNPASKVRELENIQGVKVTGFVEDIRPYYQFADVCVVPLRIAAGIQNKVLEAMSMGKPVVTTAKALDGIHAVIDEHVLVEDLPLKFSIAVTQLLTSIEQRKTLGANARKFVKQKYNWEINMGHFERLLHASDLMGI
ncbi:glycosyl transferase (group I) [Desulforapulum autotrophicum HRM2]|uniref:Glycosyl transferase (Group I) n=1 Tax=Desulforapulum autotrophicum (strain ATCC 43914 / DSM 3382 / VKM B-1955 / HRM2) TaxID=177437 RepID=C0QCK9_DESAH|nr:TIGR03087 family PEP-CTERM/XrtA system glycosyltransferase [Desulforapulum autotrophicum]ACN15086.1 glycosyl transferase (group I) [Desulforapulum autotrophicum HRM2]